MLPVCTHTIPRIVIKNDQSCKSLREAKETMSYLKISFYSEFYINVINNINRKVCVWVSSLEIEMNVSLKMKMFNICYCSTERISYRILFASLVDKLDIPLLNAADATRYEKVWDGYSIPNVKRKSWLVLEAQHEFLKQCTNISHVREDTCTFDVCSLASLCRTFIGGKQEQ